MRILALLGVVLFVVGCQFENQMPPTKVKNVAVRTSSGSALEVSWDLVPRAETYTVFYREVGTGASSEMSHEGKTASVEVTGLTEDMDYEFQVQAVNVWGSSERSDLVKGRPTGELVVTVN